MIGQRLKIARAASGLSLRELQEKIGNRVTAQAIGKYERDEDMPSSGVLSALGSALAVSEDYLLGDDEMVLDGVEFRKKEITSKREEVSRRGANRSSVRTVSRPGGCIGAAERRMGSPARGPVSGHGGRRRGECRARYAYALGAWNRPHPQSLRTVGRAWGQDFIDQSFGHRRSYGSCGS